ncbi:MAG TPA: efflux RND transporter periplasmic adaptor subunit [Candidatus Sericytochromatia bacterium]
MAKVGVLTFGKLLGSLLLPLFFISACSSREAPPNAGKPQGVPVKLQNVENGTVEESSEYLGNLEAENRVDLRPETEGRVRQIYVSAGSSVAAGTPIVQLRPEKTQAEVGGAIANVNAAVASRTNAEAQIKAVEAQRVSDAATVDLQNQQYQRISGLVAQGALPKQQLDQVTRDRDAARAALNATEEKIRAARATLEQQNAALQQAQSTVESKNEDLKETKVVAPIAGVVGDVTVKLGDYVNTNQTLTSIIQNKTLNLSLKISADRTSELRLGLPVQLIGDKDNDMLRTGRISFISPQVDAQNQQILAKASFPNPEGILRDGQKVRAKVIWKRSPGVAIPATAVSRVAGQTFIFVAQTQGGQGQSKLVARQKPIKLGEIQGNNYQVIEGVKPGEKIITSGLLNLSDGAPIIPQS